MSTSSNPAEKAESLFREAQDILGTEIGFRCGVLLDMLLIEVRREAGRLRATDHRADVGQDGEAGSPSEP